MTQTYGIDYQITPPSRYSAPIMLACNIDAESEAEALAACEARAAKLWADAGTYSATRIRVFGQNYRDSKAVVEGRVVS